MIGIASGDSQGRFQVVLFKVHLWDGLLTHGSKGDQKWNHTGQSQNRDRDLEIFKDIASEQTSQCQRRQGVQKCDAPPVAFAAPARRSLSD
jgi:hypothetical protein